MAARWLQIQLEIHSRVSVCGHMTTSEPTSNMLRLSCLLTCVALGHGFFLPSFSSSTNTQPKKSEMSAVNWPMIRDSFYYGQHFHDAGALGHAVPVAVPYPVAVPAPAPAPAQAAAAAYHNMQLVPCLCSVPKEEVEENNSVATQSSQQMQN
ncbi:hypothetical protein C0J52_14376 [Blattella germanica]|nr:hypothetical protein C0J52_14376 [Blattella germanica]